MRGVNDDCVNAGFYQCGGAFEIISGRADCRRASKSAEIVFCRERITNRFLNIFDRDQTFQMSVVINNEKFFDAVFLEFDFGFI